MSNAIQILQILSGVLLTLAILVQEKGAGLGEGVGGQAQANFQTSKRGAERFLAQMTVVLWAAFAFLSLALNFM